MNKYRTYNLVSLAFVVCLMVFIQYTTVFRAIKMSFTHDEALSYTIINDSSGWADTPNNHVLNTQLMKICSKLFGDSEISLRLPNVLACVLFLIFSFLIIKNHVFPHLVLPFFIIISCNPYVLEFFSVARGYGLSIGFVTTSLYYLSKYYSKTQFTRLKNTNEYFLAVFFAALSVLSNFTAMGYFIGLCAPIFVVNNHNSKNRILALKTNIKTVLSRNAIAFMLYSVAFTFSLMKIFALMGKGELSTQNFYGDKGFFEDMIVSLVKGSLYGTNYFNGIDYLISYILLFLILSVLFLIFRRAVKLNCNNSKNAFYLVYFTALFLPILQHHIIGTPYPNARLAVVYVVLTNFLILFFSMDVNNKVYHKTITPFVFWLIAVVILAHFLNSFNITHTFTYSEDRNNRAVFEEIEKEVKSKYKYTPISVGINWVFEPSLNYYRVSRNAEWLDCLTRDGLEGKLREYYYCYDWEFEKIPKNNELVKIKEFKTTQTGLFRRNLFKKMLFQKEFKISSLEPGNPYKEEVINLGTIPTNTEIRLELMPEETIEKETNAHIILFDESNWQETLLFHDHIYGEKRIILEKKTSKTYTKALLIYRNWQNKNRAPAINIKVIALKLLN